jgi:dienelactone hydrolase
MIELLLFLLAAGDLRPTGGDVSVRDLTFPAASGGRTAAYLVKPARSRRKGPGLLYVHWYDATARDTNRTQYLGEAIELAKSGAVSLLIETMWSEPEWFRRRDRKDDYASSLKQVRELRNALDVLAALPNVDPSRLAYVGHDFGAMYGTLLADSDASRIKAWALQAGTTSFSDWFLLGRPKLEGQARDQFVAQLAPLDPVKHIGRASPSPVFLQFSTDDRFVPKAKAEEFYAAAKDPKRIAWYDTDHSLDAKSVQDRVAWLKEVLRLK